MAVVVYKCTVCDREIEKVRNEKGLEFISRCTITDGCRGKLYNVQTKIDHARSKFPDSVTGLDDWSQRNILYNHEQAIPSQHWRVIHGMGVEPAVQVYIARPVAENQTDLVEATPESVTIVNENELIVNFERAESGLVQLVSRTSKPVVFQPSKLAETEESTHQLSTDSELSIATIIDDQDINVVLEFITPDGKFIEIDYTVDDQPSIKSPWVGTDKLYIQSKIYTTRSFNISDGVPEFADGTILNGSTMYIKSINGQPLNSQSTVLVLLTREPFAVQDRQIDSIVDISKVTSSTASASFVYNNGEITVFDTLIESVYPHIKPV